MRTKEKSDTALKRKRKKKRNCISEFELKSTRLKKCWTKMNKKKIVFSESMTKSQIIIYVNNMIIPCFTAC